MTISWSRAAASLRVENTLSPAVPVERCSRARAPVAVHSINLVEIFYAIF